MPEARLGRVAEVVTESPTWGAHLRVQLVRCVGVPPEIVPAGGTTVRAYPPPGRTVTEYAAGEAVTLWKPAGAVFALKL